MAFTTSAVTCPAVLVLLLLICGQTALSFPQKKTTALDQPKEPIADSVADETAVVRQVSIRRSNAIPRSKTVKITNLTRQHDGDEFQAHGVNTCSSDVCIGLSSGTAALSPTTTGAVGSRGSNLHTDKTACKCQCLSHSKTYREDLDICVDDIHECTLAPFVSGSSSEKIPFVFLPLHGQIIHPSREIIFPGVHTPICAVTGSQFLTKTGWSELRNPIDSDVPFRLFRDEGRTFIQWLGTPELREMMEGRLVLVHLLCRDAVLLPVENLMVSPPPSSGADKTAPQADKLSPTGSAATRNVEQQQTKKVRRQTAEKQQQMFTPCIAFRVAGTPMKYVANVTEVSFQAEPSATETSEGLTTREYIVIGICSLLLGLIYVASVLLYLHMKKRKRNNGPSSGATNTLDGGASTKNGGAGDGEGNNTAYKNDQVAFGQGFMRSGGGSSLYGSKSRSSLTGRNINGGSMRSMSASTPREEMGIVKSNPLLKHFPIHDSDVELNNGSNNELDEDSSPGAGSAGGDSDRMLRTTDGTDELDTRDGSGNLSGPEEDCLPEENVSIVDEMSSEDKLETMKAIVNGTIRRKLYFNPAYFEPDLLVTPPPAAIEFLNKIREVITIAKYKMSTKRYQPSLIDIPEELQHSNVSELYGKTGTNSALSRMSSIVSRATSSKNKDCAGCPGCDENKPASPLPPHVTPSTNTETLTSPQPNPAPLATPTTAKPEGESNCKNCGDKRNSIRKWLEGVSTGAGTDAADSDAEKSDGPPERLIEVERSTLTKTNSDSSSSSDSDTIKANSIKSRSLKGKAPPIPLTIPPPPPSVTNSLPKAMGPKVVATKKIAHQLKPGVIPFGKPNRAPPHPTTPPPPPPTIAGIAPKPPPPQSIIKSPGSTIPRMQVQAPKPPAPPQTQAPVEGIYKRGSEIYNNPQFRLGSPELPPRNQHPPQHGQRLRPSKRLEVSDQYSNTNALNLFKNMPDMVYEALANDYNLKQQSHLPTTSPYGSLKMPTPDYNDDEAFYEQFKFARNNRSGVESPYVPTPDYNTYGRTKKAGYQPDSPIYTRKSPHFLIVDYETDSLERGASKEKMMGNNTSSGSDVSSHPSPSLSAALPLEEEVEIGNAVYDQVEGFRKDTPALHRNNSNRSTFSMVSEVYVPNGPGLSRTGSKIKYNVPHAGSMTIELDHNPSEYEISTDSEQFEPDTLDRKPKNQRGPLKQVNTWNERFIQANSFLYSGEVEEQQQNLTSLPDMNHLNEQRSRLVLRSSGSFKKDGQTRFNENAQNFLSSRTGQKAFGSLREIYEAKNFKNANRHSVHRIDFSDATSIAGKILSLEEKHAKRQRQISEESLMRQKKRAPPDVVPMGGVIPGNGPHALYDYPKRNNNNNTNNSLLMAKNLTAWNTRNESVNENSRSSRRSRYGRMADTFNHDTDTCDTLSTNSDATDLTGVSETNANSEFEIEHRGKINSSNNSNNKGGRLVGGGSTSPKDYIRTKDGCYINEMEGQLGILESFMSPGAINNKHFQLGDHLKEGRALDDSDSSRPSTIKSMKVSPGSHLTSPKVFRVEVNTNTNGMQIALGLLDKRKKSKDLKNAFKKLVSRAANRFGGGGNNNKSENQESKTDDEGVSSILGGKAGTEERLSTLSGNVNNGGRTDTDCGYQSGDSNESKIYGRKYYERFNFKQVAEKLNEGSYIDLEVVEEKEPGEDDEEGNDGEEEQQQVVDNDDDETSTLKGGNDDEEHETEEHYNYIEVDRKQEHVTIEVKGGQQSEILCTGEHSIIEIKGNSPSQLDKSSISNLYGQSLAQLEYDPELLALETDDVDGGGGVSSAGSGLSSDESDDDYDVCESGAESIETNSVFFKQMRKG